MTTESTKLAILIPAAGQSSRLGQPKQLVEYNEQPLLQNRVNICAQFSAKLYCVLGAHAHKIRHNVIHHSCRFLFNPGWQNGLSNTISFGVNHLPDHIGAVMIILGDQWAITSKDIEALVEQWQAQPDKIHAAEYSCQVGVPAIFPASYFNELKQLGAQDGGAKSLLNKYRDQVIVLPMDNAKPDLDTPEQLHQMKQLHQLNQIQQLQPLNIQQIPDLTENTHGHFID